MHVETLPAELLPTESARCAAMRLGKATHPPESINEWERWACAWHLVEKHGVSAIEHADDQIRRLRAEGSLSGVEVLEDLRWRVAVLQATPEAWPGQA